MTWWQELLVLILQAVTNRLGFKWGRREPPPPGQKPSSADDGF